MGAIMYVDDGAQVARSQTRVGQVVPQNDSIEQLEHDSPRESSQKSGRSADVSDQPDSPDPVGVTACRSQTTIDGVPLAERSIGLFDRHIGSCDVG